jgi:Zn-dependent M28 family amino/carboxypeptidase
MMHGWANVGPMRRRLLAIPGVLTVAVVAAALSGCGGSATPAGASSATNFAATLGQRVTVDAMMAHLTKLQQIADANGGNRALGTPGYDASAQYVADVLRGHGFDVQTPEFEVRVPFAEEPVVTVGGAAIAARPLQWTVGTPSQGVTGPLVAARVEHSSGCAASDYDGLPVAGAVVLVDRGECEFAVQEAAAAERGALAMIVANNVDGDDTGGSLGEDTDVKIPAVGVTKATGARLRALPGDANLRFGAGVRTKRTRNVIAQTKTGSTSDVVMVGAHLDSVTAGPGINDNGSGVAALLETAVQLGGSPGVNHAVRFAFWGAEESAWDSGSQRVTAGLKGSTNYLESLNENQLKDIALYLNYDGIASQNPGYFIYDGDESLGSRAMHGWQGWLRVPEGSAGIERTLAAYLISAGKPPENKAFAGTSDYENFLQTGIPIGWVCSGDDAAMSDEQAKQWGGEAGQPFEPNYHKKTDTLEHINRTAMQINGRGVAYAVGIYAQDQGGRNGLPIRDDRTRHVFKNS